jgi:hypothetical protein
MHQFDSPTTRPSRFYFFFLSLPKPTVVGAFSCISVSSLSLSLSLLDRRRKLHYRESIDHELH